jgi:hypothetical protein
MVFVLTVDQRLSRTREDRVQELLARLDGTTAGTGGTGGPRGLRGAAGRGGVLRGFERTAGDEVQGVLADAEVAGALVLDLVREDAWHVGLGIGPVDEPLPASTRAGRGPAFVHARAAVNRAKSSPHRVCVVGADEYRARHVETVLWMLAMILRRRSPRGWEVADMLAQGRTRAEVAEALSISASAVSQRAQAAGVLEEQRGRALLDVLLAEADR